MKNSNIPILVSWEPIISKKFHNIIKNNIVHLKTTINKLKVKNELINYMNQDLNHKNKLLQIMLTYYILKLISFLQFNFNNDDEKQQFKICVNSIVNSIVNQKNNINELLANNNSPLNHNNKKTKTQNQHFNHKKLMS